MDTINHVKRDVTDNIFSDDVQIKSGNYGLTLKPSYNTSAAKTDNNAVSFTGYSNHYFPNVNACYITSGGVFGSSPYLTRTRRNLNIDNIIRFGYNRCR